jgi:hypothetical protein
MSGCRIALGGKGLTLFCPNCLAEYEEDSVWCEECEVELVEGGDAEIEYLPLLETTEVEPFARVTDLLEESGIAWFVQSEESLGLLPRDDRAEPGAPGDRVATIYVDKSRLARARDLVGAPETVSAG